MHGAFIISLFWHFDDTAQSHGCASPPPIVPKICRVKYERPVSGLMSCNISTRTEDNGKVLARRKTGFSFIRKPS
jgi:hypothetical protein